MSNTINLNKNSASSSFFVSPCTSQEMYDLIKMLKNKKAKKSLDTETRFIKYANPVLQVYLNELFNLCVKETNPDSTKIAEVIPIFRNGDCNKATDYRPISLLSQFNKIFENLW